MTDESNFSCLQSSSSSRINNSLILNAKIRISPNQIHFNKHFPKIKCNNKRKRKRELSSFWGELGLFFYVGINFQIKAKQNEERELKNRIEMFSL